MRENAAILTLCAGLAFLSAFGAAQDLRLAAKAERNPNVARDFLSLSMAECIPAPAMVYSYPGCISKAERTEFYYNSRMYSLALN